MTNDNSLNGPDHPFSMNPGSWKIMVDKVRLLERSLGSGNKIVEKNELQTVVLQRRAIMINKDLNKNHLELKDEIDLNQKHYEKLIDAAADEISNFVEKASIDKIS